MDNMKNTVGVIVGRFQVADLHTEHRRIIEMVQSLHKKVIIFLGVNPSLGTKRNPLDPTTREKMIKASYPDVIVSFIPDKKSDVVWSVELDTRIREIAPLEAVTLYGSRTSFIPHYHGKFQTKEIPSEIETISGAENRSIVCTNPLDSTDFRKGAIYTTAYRYPTSYQTVDIACIRDDKVLLCKKKDEKNLRFIGGFVDVRDSSLEHAARREFMEETEASPTDMVYIGSFRVSSWRYKLEVDKIMTSFFITNLMYGKPKPSDDIEELHWVSILLCLSKVETEHRMLAKTLMEYVNARK